MKLQIALLTALAASLTAATEIAVFNLCSYSIYVNGGELGAGLAFDSTSDSTVTVSLSADDSSFARIETSDDGTTLFYDLSLINCDDGDCPFLNNGAVLTTLDGSCPKVVCGSDRASCQNAYLGSGDEETLQCGSGQSVTLGVCQTSP